LAVFEHVSDTEVFDGDEGVGVYVLPSRLVRVVLALAGDLEVLLGCLFRRLVMAMGTLLATSGFSLGSPQSLGGPLEAAWVLDSLPFGVGDKVSDRCDRETCPNSRNEP
jgi:hypothetical protein